MAIEYETGMPRITKDGVTIVKNIATKSHLQNIGIDLIKSVSHSANELCGDGTTSAAILTSAILKHGNFFLKSGINPILMQRGLNKAKKIVESFLEEIKITFDYKKDLEKLRKVALVATNYDSELSEIIADAINKVGPHGQIFIEPSNVYASGLVVIEGGSIAKGFPNQSFLTKDDVSTIEFSDPTVLIVQFEIEDMEFTARILQQAKQTFQKPMVIFCPRMSDECISQVLFERTKNDMKICVVEAPFQGEHQYDILEDFAVLFDAKVFDKIDLLTAEDLAADYFGELMRHGEKNRDQRNRDFFHNGRTKVGAAHSKNRRAYQRT